MYKEASNTVEGFQAFLDEWVFGLKDRTEYVQPLHTEIRVCAVSDGCRQNSITGIPCPMPIESEVEQ